MTLLASGASETPRGHEAMSRHLQMRFDVQRELDRDRGLVRISTTKFRYWRC